jgi:hypothetical protein
MILLQLQQFDNNFFLVTLKEQKEFNLELIYGYDLECKHIKLKSNGNLIIEEGFQWNGATGFLTTFKLICPTLVHDALYTVIKAVKYTKTLDRATIKYLKLKADLEFHRQLILTGVHPIIAKLMFLVVRIKGHI